MFVLADYPLEFAQFLVSQLDQALLKIENARPLSNMQKRWLIFCILAIAVSNTICWKAFERVSLGTYSHAALSYMFRKSNIGWSYLLQASIILLLATYGITCGELALDDSDSQRSKQTSKIYHAHKVFDKKTGGYFNGQTIIFLLLITESISIPVGFCFYKPDPALSAWQKEDKKLKRDGKSKKDRPKKPERNADYPTKQQIALNLLETFQKQFPNITIRSILADALYGTKEFMDKASALFDGAQVISQLKKNQNVRVNGKKISLEQYFSSLAEETVEVTIRGGKKIRVQMKYKRLYVDAHQKKRLIVALKYDGQEEYRYLAATDLSWLARTVVNAFSYRWLVEVFIQDWKVYEGWESMAKQPGKEGSENTLILSLLLDHALLLHPLQQVRIKNKLPAYTVGSLLERIKVDCFFHFMQIFLTSPNPQEMFDLLVQNKDQIVALACSTKHMSGQQFGKLAPSPFLKYYYQHVEPDGI